MSQDSKDIEASTTSIVIESAPDNKTRRYDRQLRLWAASGQTALENARILVISGTATSTSILKNLVLPGIGHFTILDPQKVTPEDAGNNFFLEGPTSIGKSRAEEAVRLLLELNDGVEGKADTRSLEEVLKNDKDWLTEFTIVIAHNLESKLLDQLSTLLWQDPTHPPLVVVRSAGFLADFYIQYPEHAVIESHSENTPSLRIDNPFPALRDYALSLDFENMDVTDHGHIPYIFILIRVMEDWKKSHDGNPPKTYDEKKQFKKNILAMLKKSDEENFEEAEAQAYRVWTKTTVPSEISDLFSDPKVQPDALTSTSAPFFHLLAALKEFVEEQDHHTLPLTSTLPDMKASTTAYIHIQTLYKKRAEEERDTFKKYLKVPLDDALIDSFVKNAHALKLLRGRKFGDLDQDPKGLVDKGILMAPKALAIHLGLTALASLIAKAQPKAPLVPTAEGLEAEVQGLLPPGTELPEEWEYVAGEIERAPTADLPNTAALLGGLVAQETIKMITNQYIPINGYCTVDLIETWTGVL